MRFILRAAFTGFPAQPHSHIHVVSLPGLMLYQTHAHLLSASHVSFTTSTQLAAETSRASANPPNRFGDTISNLCQSPFRPETIHLHVATSMARDLPCRQPRISLLPDWLYILTFRDGNGPQPGVRPTKNRDGTFCHQLGPGYFQNLGLSYQTWDQ